MKIIHLYTGEDQKSHFKEVDSGTSTKQELGYYSIPHPATSLIFRDFVSGEFHNWHNAPQPQYIVYLEGEIEVITSGGELNSSIALNA
jgi:quercetin dioxygenase-like cupin family protein